MNESITTQKRRRREFALNAGAVAGLLCIVAAVLSIAFGITPLVFRSGSMAPEISTGSLAVAKSVPGHDLRVGDIVSVENSTGTRISHRVIAMQPNGDQVSLTLKGDANRAADPESYDVTEADKVLFSVPMLGYVAAWLSSTTAVFLGGVAAGVLLTLAFGPRRRTQSLTADSTNSSAPHDRPLEAATTNPGDIAAAADRMELHQENTHA